MMHLKTALTALLLLILSAAFVGCDSHSVEDSTLNIVVYNAPDNGVQTNATSSRDPVDLGEGDKINVLVDGNGGTAERQLEVDFPIPPPGEEREISFVVDPANDYQVDLLGYRDLSNDRKSALLAATASGVEVKPGEVTEIDFNTGDNADAFTRSKSEVGVDFSFAPEDSGGTVTVEPVDGDYDDMEQILEDMGSVIGDDDVVADILIVEDGGVGISPPDEDIRPGNYKNASIAEPFTLNDGVLETDKITLSREKYESGKANVLIELAITGPLIGENQDIVLFNNSGGGDAAIDFGWSV